MKRFSFGSLRVRLILLVLLATIPALGITLYYGVEHREHERQHALDDALRLAQDISETHDRLIQNARQILFTLSKTSEVQQQDKAACSKTFADIMKQSQGYTALFATKPNGDLFASSLPITHPVNFADRPWFKRLLKNRNFVIGEYQIGRVTNKPLIALAHPALDDIGDLKAILFFGMDLEWLNQTVVKSKFQEGTSVSVIDSDGTILFRYPEPEKFVGKSMSKEPIVKAMLAKREGVGETIGLGGVPRLFGFTSLGKGVESVHVAVGIPRQIALAKADRVMKDNLAYLGLIALLALAAAWFMGGYFIIHPVNRLLDTTKQLADGNLTVRTGYSYGRGEIGQLALAFDQMATSLEQREAERRQAENEVISAKARLEYLLSSSPTVIYACEPRGDYPPTFISATIKMQLGYDPEEFLSDPKFWIDRIHPEDAPRIFAELPRLFEQGHHAHEYRFLQMNGTYRWIGDEMSLIKDEEGNPLEIVGSMMDITERKRAEENLRESEDKYRTILENIEEGYYEVDIAGNLTFFNNSICRILGYPRDELMGMNNRQYTDQENAKKLYQTFDEVYRTRKPIKGVDWEVIRKDGTKRFGEVSVSLIEDSKGEPIGFRGIARDITERKKVEQDLQRSKIRFQELFDNAPVGYHEVDKEGRITCVNSTELEMLGYSAEEMVGQPIWEFIKGEENIRQTFFGKIFGKIPPGRSYERCFLRKDGSTLAVLAEDRLLMNDEGEITGLRTTIQDITEWKRAEEEIKTLKQQIEFIIGVTKTGLDIIDSEFNIRYIDPEWAKVYGDPTGRKCYEYFMDRSEVCPGCGVMIALKTKAIAVTEEILVKEGNRPIQVTTIPFRNSDGKWLVAEVNVDITERKKAEEVLRKSEDAARQIAKENEIMAEIGRIIGSSLNINEVYDRFAEEVNKLISFDRIVINNIDIEKGTVINVYMAGKGMADRKVKEIYPLKGSGNAEMVRTKSTLLVQTEDFDEYKDRFPMLLSTFQAGFRSIMNVPLFSKGRIMGGLLLRSFKPHAYTDKDVRLAERIGNQVAGAIANAQLFNELKQADEEIQRNYDTQTVVNSLLHLSLEKIPLEEILGQSLDLILSIPWLTFESRGSIFMVEGEPDILIMKVQRGMDEPIQKACAKVPFGTCLCGRAALSQNIQFSDCLNESHETSYEGIIPHGHYCVPILFTDKILGVINIYVKEGHQRDLKEEEFLRAVVNVVAGIIHRKRVEEQMASLKEQFHQSQKMEAIGHLAGGIAHDFNNILTVIKGYSQFSLHDLPVDDPLRENIGEIKQAADRASDLIRQLLALSRRQIMEMKVLDLNTVLRDMDKMLHRVIGEDIELITLLADDLGGVKTDPGWVEQIIMNLAVNARDAMPSVGKLTIETANVELDEHYARAHVAVTPGRYAMLSVSDTGVGMPPEIRDKVFEPFFTTKEKGKGTGLGLSTVYGIVKQSGGNIWVYSEPGHGTTFKIYLPRVDEPLEEIKERMVKEELPRGSETILIVEDEEYVLKLAARILERQGYTVLQTSSTSKALEICKEQNKPIHLILTDVVMPKMSGRELADRIVSFHPEIKVLYMSGYTDNAIVHHGILEEGINFMQKPFTLEILSRKVREALDK